MWGMDTGLPAYGRSDLRGGRRSEGILITGAGGEVGHGLIEALSGYGHARLIALDLRELAPEVRERCHAAMAGDVCDRNLLGRLLATYEITEIYHLAALLSTRAEYTPETAHDVNVGGTMNLLRLAVEQARSHGRRVRFHFPSSIAAYGLPSLSAKTAAGRVNEDSFLTPTTMYGCNKLYCEQLGRYYARHYRQLAEDAGADLIDFRCLRYPGLISAETLPSGGTSDFAPEMIHAAAKGEPYACFVREDTRIPFMTMTEAIEATLRLAGADDGRLSRNVYNIASFSPTAGELADAVRRHFPGAQIAFNPDAKRQAIVDTWPEDVDTTSATRDWGFEPLHDLDSAFASELVPRISARYAPA
jgi:threonine 3-dehydrogenase